MHEVGGDVVQHALIVGDEQNAQVGSGQSVDALRNDAQGVDVEAGVGFVHQGDLWLKQGHLQNLGAFLFATGEAVVDGAVNEAVIHFKELHFGLQQFAEFARRNAPA